MTVMPVHVHIVSIIGLIAMTLFADDTLVRSSWVFAVLALWVCTFGGLPLIAIGMIVSRPDEPALARRSEWDVLCMMWTWGCASLGAAGAWAGGASTFQWAWAVIATLAVASAVHGTRWMRKAPPHGDTPMEPPAGEAPRSGASRRLALRAAYARWAANAEVPTEAFDAWSAQQSSEIARGRSGARWDTLGAEVTREIEQIIAHGTGALVAEAFREGTSGLEVTGDEAEREVRREGRFAHECTRALIARWHARDVRRRRMEAVMSTAMVGGAGACVAGAVTAGSPSVVAAACAGAAATAVSAFARAQGCLIARRAGAPAKARAGGRRPRDGRAERAGTMEGFERPRGSRTGR